jgi:hypothetical protein
MVPEAPRKQVIIIMDFALGTYLYKLDGNSFQESYSLICFSWYHTVTFTCEGGSVPIIRTNIGWLVIQ